MKTPQKDAQKTYGPYNRHPKSQKKIKRVIRSPEKLLKNPKPITSKEVMAAEKEIASSDLLPESCLDDSLNGLKAPPLEKRKQDANDWKALKKVDYQRLETVVEEVQFSVETTPSGSENYEIGQTQFEAGLTRSKKPWIYNLVSITEHPESASCDELVSDKENKIMEKQEQVQKKQLSSERGDKAEYADALAGPVESMSKELNGKFPQGKRSIILNGMVEILPIFSNDKFVCSRDAISIEECEELETLDKTLPSSGKPFFEGKMQKDGRIVDDKPGPVYIRKGFGNRMTDKVGDFKEMTERKFRYKLLSDKNVIEQSSSHFINFLLVLTPFAVEREKLIAEKKLKAECELDSTVIRESIIDKVESRSVSKFKSVYGILMFIVFVLTSVFLGIAWRSYEPPCALDYVLQIIPFLHPRRTFLQLFFDRLIKLIATVFERQCKKKYLFLYGKAFDYNISN